MTPTFSIQLLQGDELFVDAVLLHEFTMAAWFYNSPFIKCIDHISVLYGWESVSDNQCGTSLQCLKMIKQKIEFIISFQW